VKDFKEYVGVLAFGLGLLFGYTFDTTGPAARRGAAPEGRTVARRPAAAPPRQAVPRESPARETPREPVRTDSRSE
jgi:hypothetical protein